MAQTAQVLFGRKEGNYFYSALSMPRAFYILFYLFLCGIKIILPFYGWADQGSIKP